MKDVIKRTIKSGEPKVAYDVTVTCNGMTPEQAQADAMNYYVWKLQRVIRDATDVERAKWAKDGIVVHYTEVGKKVESVTTTVEKLSNEQAREAYAILKAQFGE